MTDLLVEGNNQNDTARILKISQPTVNRDIGHLREKARANLQNNLQDNLPEEYENSMVGINLVLKKSWEIANRGLDSSSGNLNSNHDTTSSTKVDD